MDYLLPNVNTQRYHPLFLMGLKDNSGVDKIIVKKQPFQLLNTNREFFPSLMPPTFINWFMNVRKLGQISSPFCILYE